jgi:enterochelin esterase family protein
MGRKVDVMRCSVNLRVAGGVILGLNLAAVGAGRAGAAPAAERLPAPKLIEMARSTPNEPQFREALIATLGEGRIKEGRAITGEGADFLWAVESGGPPQLIVDDQPAEYDPKVPAAVMVWNDGGQHVNRNGGARTQNVIDNLTYQKKIPVMIQVFINPGTISRAEGASVHPAAAAPQTGRPRGRSMRSVEYDTVTDRYARFLQEEILPEVAAKYNLRKDAYSRAIAGESSGGIAAFNAAWQKPDLFSRVLSRVGTYTSIQWQPGVLDGGNIFPFLVRKTPRKNIRIWQSDGCEDLENVFGSWPLQNIQMANSLKMQGYDFHFSFGGGSHSGAHGNAEAPEALTWLWRDYDPSKTEQIYEQDPAERDKPYFRVRIYNR